MKGLRVVVTGGAGFIGSHVVSALRELGAQVTVLDHEARGLAGVVEADVREPSLVKLFADLMPQIVVHLAGQPRVVASLADPATDAAANIVGSINVINTALQAGASRIVLASSGGTIYGQARPGQRVGESQLRRPISPYGLSKSTADAYLALMAPAVGVSLALGNVYGPGDTGVCGQFVEALRCGQRPRVVGDGKQTRDFVHVTDVAATVIRACTSTATGTFNIGTGQATAVIELLNIIAAALKVTPDPVFVPWIDGEVRHSRLDIRRARRGLGWRPEIDLFDGIRTLVGVHPSPTFVPIETSWL